MQAPIYFKNNTDYQKEVEFETEEKFNSFLERYLSPSETWGDQYSQAIQDDNGTHYTADVVNGQVVITEA